MSASDKSRAVGTDAEYNGDALESEPSLSGKDVLQDDSDDPVLARKMHLVNNANDEIGWTPFHWKLFFLNGFGYAVDSLLTMVQGVTGKQAFLELGGPQYFVNSGVVAQNVGLLVGAIFWGFSADIIGRRIAFNLTLWITSVAMIIAGASPTLPFLGAFLAISTFGSGGNLILDPTVLLEFLPGDKQWVVTALAAWWGVGQSVTGFVAWGFLSQKKWNCTNDENCNWSNNAGWRYVMFTCGAIVLVTSLLRVVVVRLKETPKYLLGVGRDAELAHNYQSLARKYDRNCSLTEERLASCGELRDDRSRRGTGFLFRELAYHLKGLFTSRKIAINTLMIWASWAIIGLAYPLFYVFLPAYLSTRIPNQKTSAYQTYRDLTLTTISGIPGPLLSGYLVRIPQLGRRYTMSIGAILTMALFFGFTGVKTSAQNVGVSCAISFCLNIYYSTLYAYTVEVLPSAHRATGNGISVACNRVMGIVSAFVAASGNTATAVPLYVCAGLFGALAVISSLFPFEPQGRRSS